MSYLGSTTFICENKHMDYGDVYSLPDKCYFCGGEFKFACDTDETNGYIEDDPSTHEADAKIVGYEDEWKTDHYGNKYAEKRELFEPVGDRWRKL